MDVSQIPEGLPVPADDGAANHLPFSALPDVQLPATCGLAHSLGQQSGWVVYYIYPMTGRPDTSLPDGWDEIPGARGCTPQSCSFRDHFSELENFNAAVFGVSTQSTEYQLEAKDRLNLPFELLSDASLQLKSTLQLPTFIVDGMELYKRMTLIARDGQIEKVFYPVFPPSESANQVLRWLSDQNE